MAGSSDARINSRLQARNITYPLSGFLENTSGYIYGGYALAGRFENPTINIGDASSVYHYLVSFHCILKGLVEIIDGCFLLQTLEGMDENEEQPLLPNDENCYSKDKSFFAVSEYYPLMSSKDKKIKAQEKIFTGFCFVAAGGLGLILSSYMTTIVIPLLFVMHFLVKLGINDRIDYRYSEDMYLHLGMKDVSKEQIACDVFNAITWLAVSISAISNSPAIFDGSCFASLFSGRISVFNNRFVNANYLIDKGRYFFPADPINDPLLPDRAARQAASKQYQRSLAAEVRAR